MSFGTLYNHRPSPRSTTILAVAKANGLHLDIVHADRGDKEGYEALSKINPLCQVPTFVGADGYVLTECIPITLYITSQSDTTTLLGSSRRDYFDILKWMCFTNTELLPAIGGCILPLLGKPQIIRHNVEDCLIAMHKECKLIDSRLKGNKYLVGERLTVADLFTVSALAGAYMVFHKVLRPQYTLMTRWFDEIYSIPMYKEVAGHLPLLNLPYPKLPADESTPIQENGVPADGANESTQEKEVHPALANGHANGHVNGHANGADEGDSNQEKQLASQVRLSPEHLGIYYGTDHPTTTLEVASQLLQRNHDDHHMFWREAAGHNHTVHNILTRLALGASLSELKSGFEDNLPGQRPKPDLDNKIVKEMSDEGVYHQRLGQMDQYTNFLVFFEREIEKKGWKAVINEYCFSRSRNADALLARLYDGAFHPIIHLGLGVEFEQPSIVAEALAQAATDKTVGIEVFFLNAEKKAQKSDPAKPSKSLFELLHEARANDTIRCAAHWDDFNVAKMRVGVLGRAGQEITTLASQFRVEPEDVERKTAEMISCCAYFAGAAQRPAKARKIDFFYMHDVTSSIFLTVLINQPWISIENKVRLVEWKSRMDLVWYATCGAAELDIESADDYVGTSSANMDWAALFSAVNRMRDDGHVGKYVRALRNGEDVSKPFEHGEEAENLPVKGATWLKLAQMAYDSTVNLPQDQKWLMFAGFDQAWEKVPARE